MKWKKKYFIFFEINWRIYHNSNILTINSWIFYSIFFSPRPCHIGTRNWIARGDNLNSWRALQLHISVIDEILRDSFFKNGFRLLPLVQSIFWRFSFYNLYIFFPNEIISPKIWIEHTSNPINNIVTISQVVARKSRFNIIITIRNTYASVENEKKQTAL